MSRRMKMPTLVVVAFASLAAAQATSTLKPDPPRICDACEAWNQPQEPFRVFGNTYYVGTKGLGAVLVTSPDGHILLDGALPQSAARIDESIRQLGFRLADVRLIVNSHPHYDHAGGLAALQRASGAEMAAVEAAARVLRKGEPYPDDPQHGLGSDAMAFPPIQTVRTIEPGETLRVGRLAITAHATPGHTPGSTTWSWQSCEADRCLDIVYADSLNPVSAPGFRFTGDRARPSIVESFRRSFVVVERLPCDVLLSVHPGFSGMEEKLARRAQRPGENPFIDRQACRSYAADGRARLEKRIAAEGDDVSKAPGIACLSTPGTSAGFHARHQSSSAPASAGCEP